MGQGLEARNVIDYATLTAGSASVGLSSASPTLTAGATVKRVVITVETDQVRFRTDGTAPTSTEGHLLEIGDVLRFEDANYNSVLTNLRFIRVNTNANLKISYLD